jgi:hypothetical protein
VVVAVLLDKFFEANRVIEESEVREIGSLRRAR